MEELRVEAGDGTPIAVYDPGGDLPAAVVAHGVGSTPRYVREAFGRAVASAGHRLVTYDMRGHGRSGHAREVALHDRRIHADDLGRVVAAVDARIVGGISLGAHAAGTWAAGADGSRLEGLVVAIPALLGRVAPGEGPHAALAAEVRGVGVAGVLERVARDGEIRRWLAEVLLRDWSVHDRASLEASLLALDGGEGPTHDDLAAVGVPVGVAAWPEDPGHALDVARAWVEALPRGALEVTSLDAVGGDPAALGDAAFAALRRAAEGA